MHLLDTNKVEANENNRLIWLDSLEVSAEANLSTQDEQPLWLRSNQHGRFGRAGNLFFTRLLLSKQEDNKNIQNIH